MNTIQATLKLSQKLIAEALSVSFVEAMIDARILMQQVLKVNHAWIMSHDDETLSVKQESELNALLQRRLNGEPIAYILGRRAFYGLDLKTTVDTLIPRPETETLVDAALEKISGNAGFKVLDLGTGTGAIALAIASQRPLANVVAADVSAAAVSVASENAQNLGLTRIKFIESNWFGAINDDSFDVIVSNPPYIENGDLHLQQGDLRFEPITALASGVDGLDDIRIIVAKAPQHINQQGWLMLEHGYKQAEAVAALLSMAGFSQISHALDLAGIKRVTMGCWTLGS